jgi:hypothetical protein
VNSALQNAVDGLFVALASWRNAAVLLARLPPDRAVQEGNAVFGQIPVEFRMAPDQGDAAHWVNDPDGVRSTLDRGCQTLRAFSVETPSSRLLADQTAAAFTGLSRTLDTLVLLVSPSSRSVRGTGVFAVCTYPIGARLRSIWYPAEIGALFRC